VETFAVQPVAGTLCVNGKGAGSATQQDAENGMLVPIAFDSRQNCVSSTDVFGALGSSSPQAQAVSYAIQAGALRTNPLSGPDGVGVQEHIAYTLEARAEVQAVCVTGEITHTLKAEGFDASEDGTGRGQPIVPSLAFAQNTRDEVRLVGGDGELSGALSAQPGMKQTTYVAPGGMAVRRLTPRECERLQGFPDDYTLVPNRGKPMADGPRYKALGNSWAVPKFAWLGERIDAALRGAA
jgi:DNA (cytosine-5)-methyltransferase 1